MREKRGVLSLLRSYFCLKMAAIQHDYAWQYVNMLPSQSNLCWLRQAHAWAKQFTVSCHLTHSSLAHYLCSIARYPPGLTYMSITAVFFSMEYSRCTFLVVKLVEFVADQMKLADKVSSCTQSASCLLAPCVLTHCSR